MYHHGNIGNRLRVFVEYAEGLGNGGVLGGCELHGLVRDPSGNRMVDGTRHYPDWF